jgi:hypothetical protein
MKLGVSYGANNLSVRRATLTFLQNSFQYGMNCNICSFIEVLIYCDSKSHVLRRGTPSLRYDYKKKRQTELSYSLLKWQCVRVVRIFLTCLSVATRNAEPHINNTQWCPWQSLSAYPSTGLYSDRIKCFRMWDFRFSRRQAWRWLSYGLLRRVVWYKFTGIRRHLLSPSSERSPDLQY